MVKKMNKKAFTLIEVLVVVAIIGILALLALPRFIGHTQKAELVRVQHDVKAMEKEIGAKLINGDDSFNEWESNSKDLNKLVQDKELFENEGIAKEVEPTDGTYKVIPKEYKAKINTKLKGTFYANSGGKVYYEHGEMPGYSDEEIDDLIKNHDFIPVATAEELNNVRSKTLETYGKGTKWEDKYLGGLDKKYVQVKNIDLSVYSEEGWAPIGTYNSTDPDNSPSFTGTYDGGNYVITDLEVKGDGKDYQGLFGHTSGATIDNVSLEDIKVTGDWFVGGLVGTAEFNTNINSSYATGLVTGTGRHGGGLVGWARSSKITNSYTTGLVTGSRVGGLVGRADDSTIENSYSTGKVTGTESAGGLVDTAYSDTISNSYATGEVTGGSAGGLVDYATSGTISNSYSTGSVESTYSYVGGLVGEATSGTNIINSYSTGKVTGNQSVGGLVGEASSIDISSSYATGTVEGSGNQVGGLVGGSFYIAKISNSYATGSVTGTDNVGGLVGAINTSRTSYEGGDTISNSYATGSVTGTGNKIGGLVGYAYSHTKISNSYTTGSVKGRGQVGGLLGWTRYNTTINNSYATGSVIGSEDVGGFVGDADDPTTVTATNSYWDTVATKQPNSAVGEGKSTEDMMNKDTYTGWDFENVWEITPGNYPKLR